MHQDMASRYSPIADLTSLTHVAVIIVAEPPQPLPNMPNG